MNARGRALAAAGVVLAIAGVPARAQTLGQRGFVDVRGFLFPQNAPNDPEHAVGEVLVREEAFLKPLPWIQFAAGVDLRADTHDRVHRSWQIDFRDRGTLRPAISIRRLSATATHGSLTADLGKQFIRWGKTDIVTPTDRFAPRDFLNVVDTEFLAVSGVRGVWQHESETVNLVWVPWPTPSRTPLLDQRWTPVPPDGLPGSFLDARAQPFKGSQTGVRWEHTGGYEYSLSFFDGFNHLPDIEAQPVVAGGTVQIAITKRYPAIRMYGGDVAIPTTWFTAKGEAAYFTTTTPGADEYVVYVLQLERQTGEWLVVGGYAGEAVTKRGTAATFAPDRE